MKLLKIFFCLILIYASVAQASWILPEPKLDPLSLEERNNAETNPSFRRQLAVRFAKEFLSKYNQEFKSLNNVNIDPISTESIDKIVKYTESLSDETLKQDQSLQYKQLKKTADGMAEYVFLHVKSPNGDFVQKRVSYEDIEGKLTELRNDLNQKISDLEEKVRVLENKVEALQSAPRLNSDQASQAVVNGNLAATVESSSSLTNIISFLFVCVLAIFGFSIFKGKKWNQ